MANIRTEKRIETTMYCPWSAVGKEQVVDPPVSTRVGTSRSSTLRYKVVEPIPLPMQPITNMLMDACRTSYGLTTVPLKFPNLVTGFDRNPSHAARAALYMRYTRGDWTQNQVELYNEASASRNYSENLRKKTTCLIREIDEKVQKGQRESDRKLGERIIFWRNKVALELEKLIVENDKMQKCRHNLQTIIQNLEVQLHIAQECLYHRELRKGIDLVHDEVEKALLEEIETVRNCEKKLNQFTDKCTNQLTNGRAAQHQLQIDIQNEERTLGFDRVCHQMNNFSRGLQDYGSTETYPCTTGTESWMEVSNSIMKKSQTEQAKSCKLRSDTDSVINAVSYETFKAWVETNKALDKRVAEMLEAKKKLQMHLQKIQEEIIDVERSIALIQKIITDKSPALKIAQLETQTHPKSELCKDQSQLRITKEVEDINKLMYDINMKMQQFEAQHQQLLRTRSNLESDLKSKTDALFIDRDKCMGLRRSCPISSTVKY